MNFFSIKTSILSLLGPSKRGSSQDGLKHPYIEKKGEKIYPRMNDNLLLLLPLHKSRYGLQLQ